MVARRHLAVITISCAVTVVLAWGVCGQSAAKAAPRDKVVSPGLLAPPTPVAPPVVVAPAIAAGVQVVGNTPLTRFAVPPGAQRVVVAQGSFGAWLRNVPLRPPGTPVKLFDGTLKAPQDVHAAVLDFDTGTRDLQQCADAVMRLRAEYLWSLGQGQRACFRTAAGKTLQFAGGKYPVYRNWLNTVFNVANTASLRRQLEPVADALQVQPGDVYVVAATGGHLYGHAITVVDVAIEPGGQHWALLAQSYMPAQDIHILRNGQEPAKNNWFRVNADGSINTPEWGFVAKSLFRFGYAECGKGK